MAAAAAEMSRRKQSKPRQIKRKFARRAGSWWDYFWGGGRAGREREGRAGKSAAGARDLSNFACAAGGTRQLRTGRTGSAGAAGGGCDEPPTLARLSLRARVSF